MSIAKHKKKLKVYYSTPWSSDKNIGGANNEFISLLPDDAWVCITDGDAAWMLPNWGELVEKVIADNAKFDLIGCVTNRVGSLHQCHEGRFDTECNAFENYLDAVSAWDKHGSKVEETSGVAGLCMIFRKETWKKVGGFDEHSKSADTSFNKAVKRIGGKVGLAKGLYMMHNYRIWHPERNEARTSHKHLIP